MRLKPIFKRKQGKEVTFVKLRKGLLPVTTLCTALLVNIRTRALVYAKSTIESFTSKDKKITYLGEVNKVGTKVVGDGYLIVRNIGIGLMLIGILVAALSLFFTRSPGKREEKKTTFLICMAAAVLFFAVGAVITIAETISGNIKV